MCVYIENRIICWGGRNVYYFQSSFMSEQLTFSPTEAPSYAPTLASLQPTSTPSLLPTVSPTACLDLDDNYNTNDGVNDLNIHEIAKSIDFVANSSSSMIIDGTAAAAFTTQTIYLNQTTPQLVCTWIVTCFQSNIFCSSDQTYCNILCNGYLSCSEATIHAKDIQVCMLFAVVHYRVLKLRFRHKISYQQQL
eukprot:32328_1